MPTFSLISKDQYKIFQWKNGLGYTAEVAIFPPGSDFKKADFLWRISSAKIELASPFSVFPNHDRVLVILDGKGLMLSHTYEEGGEVEKVQVDPFTPYEFPGEIASRCELLAGAITDLSVFVRKAEVEAQVEVLDFEEDESIEWNFLGRWNFIFAASGMFNVSAPGLPETFKKGDTIRTDIGEASEEGTKLPIHCVQGPGKLVVVSLQG